MASDESKHIRATFATSEPAEELSVEAERQSWEAAVEAVNRALDAQITPAQLDTVPGEWVEYPASSLERAILLVHGGGFNGGSCKTHRELAARLARATQARVATINYRLAPEHPFPAAIEDAVIAYQWLLDQGIDARSIVIGGDSAGANVAAAALVRLRDDHITLPAAAFLISSWLDLTHSGESMRTRRDSDPLTTAEGLQRAARLYLGQHSPEHPLASPLFAEWRGLPPLLIQVGDHEILLSDATRLAERAQAAGVQVHLEIWDEMWHVWHGWAATLPEGQAAIDHIASFVHQQLPSSLHTSRKTDK